ncbi:MAG: long-chain fatty acid--CoA ligase, partial [Waterburya sp.]
MNTTANEITFDYLDLQSLPEIWQITAEKYSDVIALQDPHAKPEIVITYRDLTTQIQQFATGLQALGIQP